MEEEEGEEEVLSEDLMRNFSIGLFLKLTTGGVSRSMIPRPALRVGNPGLNIDLGLSTFLVEAATAAPVAGAAPAAGLLVVGPLVIELPTAAGL
jgi:hypothetical protein